MLSAGSIAIADTSKRLAGTLVGQQSLAGNPIHSKTSLWCHRRAPRAKNLGWQGTLERRGTSWPAYPRRPEQIRGVPTQEFIRRTIRRDYTKPGEKERYWISLCRLNKDNDDLAAMDQDWLGGRWRARRIRRLRKSWEDVIKASNPEAP